MQNDAEGNYKYVFVCGLARSGTSILGRNVARLENCTGFKDTGVMQDEGQFLQDVYPTGHKCGGPGRIGFDPRSHRTETSDLLTPENVAKLRASWHAHWDHSKAICVEKTPGNLLMTRFLQAAFPNSYFVVIRRHPVPVSMGTQRMWRVKRTPLYRLFEHWLLCHGIFEEDKKYLKHVYELTYEDYVENPDKHHQGIAAFIGTRVRESVIEDVGRAHSTKYFDRWVNLLRSSFFRRYYRFIARQYEPRFAKYGYSLTNGLGTDEVALGESTASASVGALYCFGASACAFLSRFWTLVSVVRNRIKRARQ